MKLTVSSSDREHKILVFESHVLYRQYKDAEIALNKKFYDLICETSGIWASNQDKFVKDKSQLKEWDQK